MDFPAQLLPDWLLWLSALIYIPVLALALYLLPRRRLRDNGFTHVYFAACVAMLLLWSIKAGIHPALNFHLLGVTVLTLMVGWAYAFIGVSLVALGTTLNGNAGFETFALNVLLMGLLPIMFTQLLLDLARRRLPHNFFIYVYINAFLAGGLSIVLAALSGTLLLWGVGLHEFGWLGHQYLAYFPLIFFSEALMSGMLMTMLVALRPAWVCSFDDRLYIDGK